MCDIITSNTRRIELTRSCHIKIQKDGETKEFELSFDELNVGDLLGRGQFGTVKKMKHGPTGYTFAVKVCHTYFILVILVKPIV